MFKRENAAFRRRLLATSLTLACLALLSGCVYLRLFQFKGQLKDFDRNVVVRLDQGLALEMLHPVVRDTDFTYLTESQPNRIEILSEQPREEVWTWTFQKADPLNQDSSYQVTFRTYFSEGLLSRIDFDPTLLQAVPPDAIVALFRRLGSARINQLKRSATATIEAEAFPEIDLPTLARIESVMGEPSKRLDDSERPSWNYVFNFYNPADQTLAGQFQIDFKSDQPDPSESISSFELTGKAR